MLNTKLGIICRDFIIGNIFSIYIYFISKNRLKLFFYHKKVYIINKLLILPSVRAIPVSRYQAMKILLNAY